MDDLWSRIQQQNAEMDAENALAEHEEYARQQTTVRRLGKGSASPPNDYGYNYGGDCGMPSEAEMRERCTGGGGMVVLRPGSSRTRSSASPPRLPADRPVAH